MLGPSPSSDKGTALAEKVRRTHFVCRTHLFSLVRACIGTDDAGHVGQLLEQTEQGNCLRVSLDARVDRRQSIEQTTRERKGKSPTDLSSAFTFEQQPFCHKLKLGRWVGCHDAGR